MNVPNVRSQVARAAASPPAPAKAGPASACAAGGRGGIRIVPGDDI